MQYVNGKYVRLSSCLKCDIVSAIYFITVEFVSQLETGAFVRGRIQMIKTSDRTFSHPPIHPSIIPYVRTSIRPSVCPSVRPFVQLSIYMYERVSVCLRVCFLCMYVCVMCVKCVCINSYFLRLTKLGRRKEDVSLWKLSRKQYLLLDDTCENKWAEKVASG